MIRLTPHALDNPIEVSTEDYDQFVRRTDQGWSHCASKEEYLSKLHYLREGRKAGKIDESAFLQKEKNLVISWWKSY